jgi:hypothetical protein
MRRRLFSRGTSGFALRPLIVRMVTVFLAATARHPAMPAFMRMHIGTGHLWRQCRIGKILSLVAGAWAAVMTVCGWVFR